VNTSHDVIKALRVPRVLVPILATVVVVILWLVVFYLPQSSKLSKLNTQQQSLQAKQVALQAELTQLQHLQNSGLSALSAQYDALLPPTIDNTGYLKLINSAVQQAGATLLSFTPGTATTNSAAAVNGVNSVPISLNTTGTYDQEIKLMQLIYGLPRLTVINSLSMSGGGPTSNRATVLDVTYSMTIFDTSSVSP
jgi:Tfp pilus assembly protein PilO